MPAPRGLVQRLDQHLHRSGLLPRGARLLVAVSGGADSVALLRLLHAVNQSAYWRWTLVVGHVDHGMRGRASAGDARFVERLAETLELRGAVVRLRLGRGTSEDAARQARLAALGRLARRFRCAGVVMAHHGDDQAETVVMRICRGCGLAGLSAMAADATVEGVRIFRPLLDLRRRELVEYLRSIGQKWREDRTNTSRRFLRNRVRREVMPLLEKLWPRATAALCRLAKIAGDARQIVDDAMERELAHARVVRGRTGVRMRRADLRKVSPELAPEILLRLVEEAGGSTESADFERIGEAVRAARGAEGGKTIEMGRRVIVELKGETLRVSRRRGRRRK